MAQLKSTSVVGNLAVTGNVVASQIIKNNSSDDKILLGGGGEKSITDFTDAIGNANTAAVNAQNRADAAYTLAESKTTMGAVEAKNYATKAELQTEANNRIAADATKVDDLDNDITTWIDSSTNPTQSSLSIGKKSGDGILSLCRGKGDNKWVNLRVENSSNLSAGNGLNLYLPTDLKNTIYNADGSVKELNNTNDERTLATRHYAVHKTGDTMSGKLTVPTLAISSTGGVSHIKFARDSYNYLHVGSNKGSIVLCANSELGLKNSSLVAGNTGIYPGDTNTYSLGTSGNKWKEAYIYGETVTGTITSTSISDGGSTYDRILMASDAGLIGYRTKIEFIQDLELSQVYNYKGTLTDLNALKSIASARVGDVYFISATSNSWACKTKVTAATGDNYETYWSNLGNSVDLSGYMTLDTTQTITGQKTFNNNLSINSTSNTNMSTPTLHVLHTGPATGSDYADLMVLAGFNNAPYGFKFRTHGSGTAIIQSQRIGNNSETFPLSLNPNGGDVLVGGKLIQGTKNTHVDVASMNQFTSDLYVKGDGSAPNCPRVAGFYLGKSQGESDENRHMDIVSGDTVSYIDFNKASYNIDYSARLYVDVSNGATYWRWGGAEQLTNKLFTIEGNLHINNLTTSSHVSQTWENSCRGKSAFNINNGSYTGWISGYTKNGRMAISTYPNEGDKLYFIYMHNDTTENTADAKMAWDGANYTLSIGLHSNSGGFKYNHSDRCLDIVFN